MLTCSRCGPGVRAHWRAKNDSGHELLFCAHCASRNRPALIEKGWLLSLLPGGVTPADVSCARAPRA